MYQRLSTQEKIRLIRRVLGGEPLAKVCREVGISRTIFYQWLKKYQQAAPRAKRTVLTSKVAQGLKHWRRTLPHTERKVVKAALQNPSFSPQKISQIVGLSTHGVWNVLRRHGLNTQQGRMIYLHKYGSSLIKPPTIEDKLTMIRRFETGEEIAGLCREFNLSRTAFYKWLKRYQKASEGIKRDALESWRPKGERHWRFVPEGEKLVLDIVRRQPALSSQKISQQLLLKKGKPILGNHGVYNLLKRLNLNTYQQRLAFAKSQVPTTLVRPVIGWLGWLKTVFETFVPQLAPFPPPLREKISSGLKPFFASLIASTFLFNIFAFWLRVLSQAPTSGDKVGVFFATIALLIGGFFFTYSMKYYLTLALVLSFSRQSQEEGGGYTVNLSGKFNGRQNGYLTNGHPQSLWGWLKKIFNLNGNGHGLGNGYQDLHKFAPQIGNNDIIKGGGLQPNLDHIKPQRFPFFSIHLPFYNEKRVAERIIKACMAMDYFSGKDGRPNYEVIVCDDSTDETVEIVLGLQKKLGKVSKYIGKDGEAVTVVKPQGKPILKVIHRQTRSGFKGGALSYALQNLDQRTEFVCVFDADFIPYPDTLTQFLKYFKATGGWNESRDFRAKDLATMAYDTNESVTISSQEQQVLNQQVKKLQAKSKIACVAGYQWHVLNKSENWITRGVRTEYAGSYVIERPGQEILGAMKIIHGSVYCIRADVLKHFGWGTSITEDYELTLRIYEHGFRVVFTPYIQAPSECVSTLKRLIRQRMRWAEGHSYCTRRQFLKLIFNPQLTWTEKLEFLYLTPYYLQAAFFIVGTLSWLISETVFKTTLPFWTALWGWSLVLTNFFALPLVNGVGLFLEESEEKDYLGILSFIALCYIVVPFQAYAAVKGFLEPKEGTWFRTPKSGRITDIFTRGKFYRWIAGILPGRKPALTGASAGKLASVLAQSSGFQEEVLRGYLALATASNQFNKFKIPRRQIRWVSRTFLVSLLVFSTTLLSLAPAAPYFIRPGQIQAESFGMLIDPKIKNLAKEVGDEKEGSQEENSERESKINELASRFLGSVKDKSGQVLTFAHTPAPTFAGAVQGFAPRNPISKVATAVKSWSFTSQVKRLLASNHGKVLKKDFRSNEEPELIFQFPKELEQKNLFHRLFNLFKVQASSNDEIKAKLFDNSGEEIATNLVVSKESEGNVKIKVPTSSSFKPGAYKLKVDVVREGETFTQEQDFTWGVLAINVNKSIYTPGETAYIQMAALKDDGHTLCDANLRLEITTPENKIISPEVQKSGECKGNNVTTKPDYFSYTKVDKVGIYKMILSNLDNNYQITDIFEVKDFVPFEIERQGPTRIYPFVPYPMQFKIKANIDFEGEIEERIPKSFEVKTRETEEIGEWRILKQKVKIKAGETFENDYFFDAPDISPYLYQLGPLRFIPRQDSGLRSGQAPENIVFQESRFWQIAADATTTLRPNANGTYRNWTITDTTAYGATSDLLDSTYVTSPAADTTTKESENMDDFSQTFYTIDSVTVSARCCVVAGAAAPEKGQVLLRTNSTDYLYPATAPTLTDCPTFSDISSDALTTNPNTGLAWTDAQVDAMEVGAKGATLGAGEQMRCSEFWAVVTYTPPAAGIDISGSVKGTDESSFIGNPPCNGTTAVVSLRVNGGTESTIDCDDVTGNYSFTSVSASAGDTVTIYLNASSTPKANLVMVAGSAAVTDANLFQDRVIVRDEQDGTVTNADLADYDNDDNPGDMLFTANLNAMDTDAGTELHIWAGDTYRPYSTGGITVTLSGSYHNAGTATWDTNITTFDSTSTGNNLWGTLDGSSAFYKVNFNGSGGSWTIKNPMKVSAANATDTLKVTAGTVTLGDGGGDDLEVDGKLVISSGATLQTMTGLAQGNTITININAPTSPPACANCIVDVSGNFYINTNAKLMLNSNSTAESGVQISSTGYFKLLGSLDDSGTATSGTNETTIEDTGKSWSADQHNNKRVRMSSGLAIGRTFAITDTTTTTLVRSDNSSGTDTNPTVSGSGNSRTISLSIETIVTADNDHIGRYVHDTQGTAGWYLIVDSTETGSDTLTIVGDPDSLSNLATGDDIEVSDGVRSGDGYEIIDYAELSANATNNGYVSGVAGSEFLARYADISEMGTESSPKYGLNFANVNGANANEGVTIDKSRIYNCNRCIRLNDCNNIDASYSEGITDNEVFNSVNVLVDFSGGRNHYAKGNRLEDAGTTAIELFWAGRMQIFDNIIIDTGWSGIQITGDVEGDTCVFSGNSIFDTGGAVTRPYGIYLTASADETIVAGNKIYHAPTAAIYLENSLGLITAGNTSGGGARGIYISNTTGVSPYIIGDNLGLSPHSTSDINITGGGTHKLQLFGTTLSSSTELSGTATWIISRKHDATSGQTNTWLAYTVPDDIAETPNNEGIAKFNYANNLWEDSFTPHYYTGTGTDDSNLNFAFDGGSLGGSASYYVYYVVCNAADCVTSPTNAWDVFRDGVDIGDATTAYTYTDSTTNVQFKIDDAGTNFVRGDVFTFVAFRNSNDASSQKTLAMMQTGDSFTVGSGETIQLLGGSSANKTLVQKAAAATSYSFTISGGTINANYYKFTGTDASGLNISSGAVTDLDNGVFDDTGGAGAADTYMTVTAAIINAGAQTWTGMIFDEETADSNVEKNVTLSGIPTSCDYYWTFVSSGNKGGATNGEANDVDTDADCSGVGYLRWQDVGNSSALLTAWSFQRKTFYDANNLVYWRFSYDGTQIAIEYNSSPWDSSWAEALPLSVNTNDFSVWLVPEDTYVYICYKTGFDIEVKRGSLTTTAINWGTTGIGLNGSDTSDTYSYCGISRDSSGYLWVLGTHYDGTNYEIETADSTAVDPATPSFNASTSISNASNTDANTYGVIVPLGATGRTQDVYAVWTRGTTIEGARWDDSDAQWENIAGNAVPANSPDSIATGVTGLVNNMSAVVDSTFDIHLAHVDNSNDIAYKKFDESVPSWSSPTAIDTGTFAYPTISLDTDTQDLYVIYMDQVDNSIDYRQYDVSAVQWLTVQSNWRTTTSGAYTTSNYKGAGRIFLEWTSEASSPYTLNWDYIIIPEKIWLFLVLGLVIPGLLRRRRRMNFANSG